MYCILKQLCTGLSLSKSTRRWCPIVRQALSSISRRNMLFRPLTGLDFEFIWCYAHRLCRFQRSHPQALSRSAVILIIMRVVLPVFFRSCFLIFCRLFSLPVFLFTLFLYNQYVTFRLPDTTISMLVLDYQILQLVLFLD